MAETLEGLVIHGTYKGYKSPRPYTDDRTGETRYSRHKLGVETSDGTVYEVPCTEESFIEFAGAHAVGDPVSIPVRARPPFGSPQGAKISYQLATDDAFSAGAWES